MALAGTTAREPEAEPEATRALRGWMWVWTTIGILVALVVIGYLLPINNALGDINGNLATADEAVGGAGGDVNPLPNRVGSINGSLGNIDQALKPIPNQADQIIAALSSIRSDLQSVDASLKDTSGSLVDTSGSLVDTSDTLITVLGVGRDIERTLESVQGSPPGNPGTGDIAQQVPQANRILTAAKGDTGNVLAQLVETDAHLNSICSSGVGGTLPGNCPG